MNDGMDAIGEAPSAWRLLLRTCAWLATVPYFFVLLLVVTGVATWSGVLYVLALGVMLGGLVTMPTTAGRRPSARRPRGVTRGALGFIAVVGFVRACTGARGEELLVRRSTADVAASAPWVDRLVDEGDVALAGTRALVATGMLHDDARELPGAMRAAYTELRAAEGDTPSPVLPTYLGLQRGDAFDVVMIEPREPATAAVIFLHGFAGNFDLPCWQVARSVRGLGVMTACPSTRWVGDWWNGDGAVALRRTVDMVHERGVRRIVLVGLSNGAHGAALLAPRFPGVFSGLVLVSGAPADAPPAKVPTLVLHGRYDTMASARAAREYATEHGARFVSLDAGHFAMLVRRAETDHELRGFVAARIADGARSAAR